MFIKFRNLEKKKEKMYDVKGLKVTYMKINTKCELRAKTTTTVLLLTDTIIFIFQFS